MPRREDETSPRPDASGPPPEDRILSPHLDEGTAHAWLDGALAADEAARAAAHVAGCAACAALVAEAQGLLAGASRILGALDEVPGGVLPRDAAREAARDAALSAALAAAAAERRGARGARRAWFAGVPLRAAAAVLLVAGVGSLVVRSGDMLTQSRGSPTAAMSDSAASAPMASSSGPSAALDVSSSEPAPQAEQRQRDVLSTARESATAVRGRDARVPAGVQDVAGAGAAAAAATSGHARAGDAERFEARRAVSNAALARLDSQPMAMPRAPMASAAPAAVGVAGGLARMREGVLAGRVTTPDGRPVGAAQVQLVGRTQGAVTDDSGRFVVPGVVPGGVTVQARRIGYEPRAASVVVAASDTTRTTLVLRSSTPSEVVVTGQAIEPVQRMAGSTVATLPAPPRALASPARTDSAALSERLDGAVDEARRRRASRLLPALGCHALTPAAGGAVVSRPTQLTLLEATASRRAGPQSYVARVLPDGATGEWTPLDGDSLRIAWTVARGSIVVRLSAPADGVADERRGVARMVDARGNPGTPQPVTARRVACQPAPRR